MKAAVKHQRDGQLLEEFTVDPVENILNDDGTETYVVRFPRELTVLEGDDLKLTYSFTLE